MVKEEKTDPGNVYEQSGNFLIGHMSGGELKNITNNYSSIPPFVCLDHQLPSTSDFQGREKELKGVQGWLEKDGKRFVGIVSPGGYGKSTLAARIYQESSAFKEKLWITLNQSYSFNSFSNGLLNKLGEKVHINCSDDSLKNQLINYFFGSDSDSGSGSDSDSSFLLVIDNLDFLLRDDRNFYDPGYNEFFQQWLTKENNNNTLLFTSRKKPTTLGKSHLECEFIELQGLSEESGLQLLRKKKIAGTPQNLQRFVQIADGHPLLLNLAASWLHDRPTETPDVESILRENDLYRFEQLVGLHRGKSEATVGQVLATSLEGLTDRLRELWLNLSVYKYRSIDLKAAQSVATETITDRDLRELARRSLLEEQKSEKSEKSQDQRKYRFLNLVNKFAQQQAGARKEVKQKAIEYCRSVAMPSGWDENDAKNAAIYRINPKPLNWKTEEDIAEYLEIFHYYYEMGQYDVAFSFLWNTGCDIFLELRGDNSIRVDLYTILMEKWRNRLSSSESWLHCLNNEELDIFYVEQRWFAEMLNCLGTAHRYLGHYSLAIELHQEALNKFFQLDDSDREKARTINYLGKVYYDRGEYQQAESYFEQAREIFHRINDAFGESLSLQDLIDTDSARGLHHNNIDRYQRILTLERQFYHLSVEANTLNKLGITYYKIGKYQYAICIHRKALHIFKELHHQQGQTESWHRLGDAYEALGRYQDAIDAHDQALRMSGDRLEQANARCRLGWDLQSSGDSEAAIEKFNWALAIFQELDNRSGEAIALNGLGVANRKLGNHQQAESYYTDALDIHRQLHDLDGEAVVLNNLGTIYEQQGQNLRLLAALVEPERNNPGIPNYPLPGLEQYRQAIDLYQQSLETRNRIPDRDLGQDARTRQNLGRVCNLLGQSYYNCRQYQEAARLYQQALNAFKGIQRNFRTNEIKEGEATALLGLGNAYHFLGQYLDAICLHQQTVKISCQLGDRPGEAEALLGLGNTYYALGQYNKPDDKNALSCYEKVLTIFQDPNDWQGIARVQLGLGKTYHSLGKCQTAIEYLDCKFSELSTFKNLGDRAGEADTLDALGRVYQSQGKYQDAIQKHEEALEIRREIGDRAGKATSLNNLGDTYYALRDYERAQHYCEEARNIFSESEIDAIAGLANVQNSLGVVYCSLGFHQRSISFIEQARETRKQIGDRAGEGDSLCNLGCAYFALKDLSQSRYFYTQALGILNEIGHRELQAKALSSLGDVDRAENRHQDAIQKYERSWEIFRNIGNLIKVQNTRCKQAENYCEIAEQEREINNYYRAIESYEKARIIFNEIGDKNREIKVQQQQTKVKRNEAEDYYNTGNELKQLRQYKQAIYYYERARKIIKEIDQTEQVKQV